MNGKRKPRTSLRIYKLLIPVALLLGPPLFTGCKALSPESRIAEVDSPGQWASSKEARAGIDRNWIGKIGGSELRRLVEQAISGNQDLNAAAARVDRAAAEARLAGIGRLPSLGLGLDGQRSQQNFIGFPFAGGGSGVPSVISQQFGVNLNIAWEIDIWGRLKAGEEAAIADAEARKYDYDAARVSLAGQVTKAWLALAESNEQVALAGEGLEARKTLANAVRERFERAIVDDGGSAAQVRLTAAEVANGEGALAQRKQERERSIRQLEILLGKYPSGSLRAGAELPSFPGSTPSGLPSELLQRRPDILAAERAVASAGRRVKARKLARFPSLNLTGSGGTNTESLSDVLDSDFKVWSIGGSATQPIFQGGVIGLEIEEVKSTEREQIAVLKKTVLAAFGEVEQALVAETYLAERERAAKKAADLFKEAAERSYSEFDAGTGSVLTLIEAKEQEINSASQYVAIKRLRLENRVDLHLALGGGFRAVK